MTNKQILVCSELRYQILLGYMQIPIEFLVILQVSRAYLKNCADITDKTTCLHWGQLLSVFSHYV
jgi:hypothetical protein